MYLGLFCHSDDGGKWDNGNGGNGVNIRTYKINSETIEMLVGDLSKLQWSHGYFQLFLHFTLLVTKGWAS